MSRPDPHARAAALLARARADGRRRVLGIAGSPGAGKSMLAAAVVDALGPEAVGVGMDGWHLANTVLDRLGRRERKGAPDTFDAAGYVAFLRRVREQVGAAEGGEIGGTVWAPEFRREVEEPIAGALAVGPRVRVLVTEGNYLLLDRPPWDAVRPLLDEAWFLAPDEAERREWLVARHVRHGRSPQEAATRADGSDATNAALVATTAERADLVLRSPTTAS